MGRASIAACIAYIRAAVTVFSRRERNNWVVAVVSVTEDTKPQPRQQAIHFGAGRASAEHHLYQLNKLAEQPSRRMMYTLHATQISMRVIYFN